MRLVSIVGDSVSTFEGFNPRGYAVFYDQAMQTKNGLRDVYDTWWAKVNQGLHAYLCVNNSYSGSRVSGVGFPAGCCEERLWNLKTAEYMPHDILIYLGFNDFGNGVRIYADESAANPETDTRFFMAAYEKMIRQMKTFYPSTRIICGTLMRTCIQSQIDWVFPETYAGVELEEYNYAIRTVAAKEQCFLADLSKYPVRYETLDGSHPTVNGHRTIAETWLSELSALHLVD